MFEFLLKEHKYSHIHFIGIGGISMSGLAEILLDKGYKVSGTDTKESGIINRLIDLGAKIYIGHNEDNIKGADLIIYTDAIAKDNVELIAASNSAADLVDRATFLGALMKNYDTSIAISGTHGKTTTTSMLSTIATHANLNPTILLGGQLDEIGGNVKIGNDKYIITEACEYKGNILKYYPTIEIVLNIDEDHLDYFTNLDHIVDTFIKYGQNLTEEDYLIINADDPHAQKVIDATKAKVISFGINSNCDYKAENIILSEEGFPKYTLNYKNEEFVEINLNVMGNHNIYNSIGAMAASHILGISLEDISEYIGLYKGVHRRLELIGYIDKIKVLDDYAHHPTEIKASLNAVRKSTKSRIICVFQPHTFTRTKSLLNSFSEAFTDADITIIADIYAARELDNGEIHSRDLVNRIKAKGNNAVYLSSFEEIEEFINKEAKDDDIVLTMGAGNVYQIGKNLLANSKSRKAV